MKNIKNIFLAVVILFVLVVVSGCTKQSTDSLSISSQSNTNEGQKVSEESKDNSVQENTNNKASNKMCDWIDESDVVIQLDLPEEYAHFNDKTIFPSYEVGFMFKSSYGDIASSRRLAQKGCDYRVGFSKEDFIDINYNPNYPFIIYASRGSALDFVYENEPIKITLKDDLPEQGNNFIIKVTGETQSFDHYDSIFE